MSARVRPIALALVGATGTVGRTVLEVLDDLDVPVKSLRPFASPRSAGTTLGFRGDDLRVETPREGSFRGCDVAIFCAGPAVAREWAPRAWSEGCAVVDDSPAFRMEPDVPLVVPEVNGDAAAGFRARGIVANPSSNVTALALALAPLRDAAGLRRVVVATYQSASGLGQGGVEELEKQARDLLNLREPDPAALFPHRLAFNLIPQVGPFVEGGATEEEAKIVRETRKVLGDPELGIAATAVRVPVFFGHSAAVNVATVRPLGAAAARAALAKARGREGGGRAGAAGSTRCPCSSGARTRCSWGASATTPRRRTGSTCSSRSRTRARGPRRTRCRSRSFSPARAG